MTYKALTFFDLDGTLLDEHSQITSEIAEAMAMLRKNQVCRSLQQEEPNLKLPPFVKQLGSPRTSS